MVEFLQQNGLYELFWIVSAIIIYRFSARFFEYVHLVRLVQVLHLHTLTLLGGAVEDIAFIKQLKYKTLEEQGASRSEIRTIKEVDAQALENWKKSVIRKFVDTCPAPFRALIRFSTWDEAMEVLTEYYRRRGEQ